MAVSERAIGSALAWPTPLACLYSLAMETGIGIRDYWHEDSGIAAIVDGKVIALSCGLADDGLRADVLAMALEVAIAMTNRPGTICAPRGFAVITPHRVPAPAAGAGKFATLVARACGRDTASAAFEYYVPRFPGDGHEPGATRRRLTAASRLVLPRASYGRPWPASMLPPCPGPEGPDPGSAAGARTPTRAGHDSFPGQVGRWDSLHRAPGVGHAVAADLAANHPGQRPAVPCPHHQQVTRGSDTNQDPARLAALEEGPHRWISGNSGPTPR
jgi:hypothetical protein